MGRHASGWRIRLPSRSKTYSVLWWDVEQQRQIELSTRETDVKRATEAAKRIYADYYSGKIQVKSRGVKPGPSLALEDVALDWIEAKKGQIAANTLASYSGYFESHLVPYFPSLSDVTTAKIKGYISDRLKVVRGLTVRKELSALRGLVSWAAETGLIPEAMLVPGVPKKVQGTAFATKRRSKPSQLSVVEIETFLAHLPVEAPRLGFVRSRFVLQYDMGLRPSLVDRLEAPKHWYPGSDRLTLDAKSMKGREDSDKLLTKRAKEALEQSYRGPGLLFGTHDYRLVVAEAARLSLPTEKAKTFTAAHLRSAGITHLIEDGATLSEAQVFADHKLATTTDRYIKTSQRALEDFLRRQGRI